MKLVLDTNIVLDLFVFNDAAVLPLQAELTQGHIDWVATQAMRDELERVLAYEHIEARLAFYGLQAHGVLSEFDRRARIVPQPARASVSCRDADDQIFIDLAVAHECLVLSKDAAVLSLKKRLLALGADAAAPPPSRRIRAKPAPSPDAIPRG